MKCSNIKGYRARKKKKKKKKTLTCGPCEFIPHVRNSWFTLLARNTVVNATVWLNKIQRRRAKSPRRTFPSLRKCNCNFARGGGGRSTSLKVYGIYMLKRISSRKIVWSGGPLSPRCFLPRWKQNVCFNDVNMRWLFYKGYASHFQLRDLHFWKRPELKFTVLYSPRSLELRNFYQF